MWRDVVGWSGMEWVGQGRKVVGCGGVGWDGVERAWDVVGYGGMEIKGGLRVGNGYGGRVRIPPPHAQARVDQP